MASEMKFEGALRIDRLVISEGSVALFDDQQDEPLLVVEKTEEDGMVVDSAEWIVETTRILCTRDLTATCSSQRYCEAHGCQL